MNNLTTNHKIYYKDSSFMRDVKRGSVDLVVTSPPYPMIEMWDEMFIEQNKSIKAHLKRGHGKKAFRSMHIFLNTIWDECYHLLKEGGIACINIGDATRTIDGNFMIYPNSTYITSKFMRMGFDPLPSIIWKKQTNAPNKFMGSGMLPPGAYVTLEHEHILIFRKGRRRLFKSDEEKALRQSSSYFWEERNKWFSDTWDIKGVRQKTKSKDVRNKSAAFPFELPYRLINMFSLKGDTVLDPFCGLGTTNKAAMASCRNSIGYEIDSNFDELISSAIEYELVAESNSIIAGRLLNHLSFVKDRQAKNKPIKHMNDYYDFPVMTKHEKNLRLESISSINKVGLGEFEVNYPQFD